MKLLHGDCLGLMSTMPDGSVDMILCDPPYGTVKGMELCDAWKGATNWDNAIKPEDLFNAANKVLRTGGCLCLFSQEPYTSKLITEAHGNLPFSYRSIWKKENFANYFSVKVAPVNYFEDIVFFFKKYDTKAENPIREYAKKIMQAISMKSSEITEVLGHMGADHFFRINSTQFGLCTEKTYNELIEKFGLRNMIFFKEYSELQEINSKFNRRFNRRFNLEGKKYKSNILEFRKDYGGLHPTQKPVALIEYLIRTYTNEGETVLDNCMGSGTTGVACLNTGREFIGIEKDDKYFTLASERIEQHTPQLKIAI
jgi:DNA modification methylase